MADSGGLYSLLGQVTTDQYKRDAREERKYRKDLERQRLKAMLLQPVIAGAVNVGKDVISDVAGNLFLPDGGKDFLKLESSRPFLTKIAAQTTANKDLLALQTRLKAENRIDDMITEAADRQAAQLGIGAKDGAYKTILSFAENKRADFIEINNAQLAEVRSKLSSLDTGTRSSKEMLEEIKAIDSKSNFSRIARNLFKGYSQEEASAADRRQIFTGERTKSTIYDAEYEKFKQSSYATDLETEILGIKSFDAVETKKLLTQIQKDNPDFYGLLGTQAENRVAVLTAANNAKRDAPKDSIVSKFFNSGSGIDATLKGNVDAFKTYAVDVIKKSVGTADEVWNRISSSEQGRLIITNLSNTIIGSSDVFSNNKGDIKTVEDRLEQIYSSVYTQLNEATTQLLSDPESLEIVGNLSVEKYNAFLTDFTNHWVSRNTKLIQEEQLAGQGFLSSFDTDKGTSDIVLAPNTSETIKSAFFRFIQQDNIDPDTQQPLGYETISERQFRKTTELLDKSLQTIFGNAVLTVEGKMEAVEETLSDWASTSLENNQGSIIQNNEVTFDRIKEFANRTYAEMADELKQPRKNLASAYKGAIFSPMAGLGSPGMSVTGSTWNTSSFPDGRTLQFKEVKVDKSSPDYAAKVAKGLETVSDFFGVPSTFQKLFNIDLEKTIQNPETINGATTLVKQKVIEVTDSPPINRQSTLNEVASNILNLENSGVVLDLAQKWSNFVANFDAIMNSTDKPTTEPEKANPSSSLLTPSATSRMLEPIDNSLLSRVSEEEETSITTLLSNALELVPNNDKFKPIPQELFQVVVDMETNASESIAKRNLAFSGHAHGIGQLKTATAISPGYNVPNIFDTADELGITYDPELKSEAINQQKTNAKNNNGMKDITGDAGKEVIRLLQSASVNLTMSARYLSSLYKRYDGDIAKTLLGYNQGPSVAAKWDGNIESIPKKNSEGVGYLRKANAILSFLES